MQTTPKESSLLKDMKKQEKLCVEKYAKSAENAKDEQLKQLFCKFSNEEEEHYDWLTGIENGTVPTPPQSGANPPTFSCTYNGESEDKKNDAFLCSDLLSMEKHVSHTYDTSIFEFTDQKARDLLNMIQSQEQGHGKAIYDYMSANNMYS